MQHPIILVVDDDPGLRKVLNYSLNAKNYTVYQASDAQQALVSIKDNPPDLILLDWMMPGLSGFDLLKNLRAHQETRDIPIIMLTAKATEDNQVKGLLEGADDYITKPFSIRELNARIQSLLRRAKPHISGEKIILGVIEIDPKERYLILDGVSVTIGHTEFHLLHFFITHPKRVYSRTQILDHVWGVNKFIQERTVDVHILRLRKLLEAHGMSNVIETVRGLGYRLSYMQND